MVRRLFAVVAVLALALAACSGDTAEPTSPAVSAAATTAAATASKPATSAVAKTTTSASAAQTTMPAIGGYSFAARYIGEDAGEFAWEWTGSFSIVAGNVEGSGTVVGTSDGVCGIEGGTMYPVAYTATGEFDITGTADDAVIEVVLRPVDSKVDLTVGDLSQLCVELSVDAAQGMLDFPLGDAEQAVLPIEVSRGGGITSLDFGDGFVIEAEVVAL